MMAESNDGIGVSPAQLLFGNSIQLDRGIFLPNLPREGVEAEIALSDWADKMFEAQRVLLDTAQRLQQQKDARHMRLQSTCNRETSNTTTNNPTKKERMVTLASPARPMSCAAMLDPTMAHRFGAILCIMDSMKASTSFLSLSRRSVSSQPLKHSFSSTSVSCWPAVVDPATTTTIGKLLLRTNIWITLEAYLTQS
jgi:hypothetical protein